MRAAGGEEAEFVSELSIDELFKLRMILLHVLPMA